MNVIAIAETGRTHREEAGARLRARAPQPHVRGERRDTRLKVGIARTTLRRRQGDMREEPDSQTELGS